MPGGPPDPNVLPGPEKQNRLSRLRPDDFMSDPDSPKGMTEWIVADDKLPEGIEEIKVSMASSGDKPKYQWMIDPASGPPVEGTAASAEEAFMAIRGKLTEHAGGFGQEFGIFGKPEMGGMPPGGKPGMPGMPHRPPVLKAFDDYRRLRQIQKKLPTISTPSLEAVVDVDDLVDGALESITKGLVAADIFVESATGADLRDILPTELLDEMSSKLSAAIERRG
jgi:hypothetical protein